MMFAAIGGKHHHSPELDLEQVYQVAETEENG